ncbi:ArdC family protein [Bradyrhizobium brasilense]|uniref:ArdC family protein n=1 Tax=Bradyrhizobium brasilense TaxID=1419277 RepID=UPI0032214D06
MPKNASTNRKYQHPESLRSRHRAGVYRAKLASFRQALSLEGHVGKAERGTTVVHAGLFVPGDEKRRGRTEEA